MPALAPPSPGPTSPSHTLLTATLADAPLRRALDASDNAVVMTNSSKRVVYVNEGFTRGHHKDSQRQHEEFVHIKKGKNRLRVLVFLRNKAKNTRRRPMTQAGRSIFRFRSFFIRRGSIRAGR